MADMEKKIVLIPVQVDIFSFKESDYFYMTDEAGTPVDPLKQADKFAIFAPINPPDYRNLQLHSDLIRHDIYGNIDFRGVDYNGAYMAPRLWNSYPPAMMRDFVNCTREGLYLHWRLPKTYRQGISATPSAQNVNEKEKLRQGFHGSSSRGTSSSATPPPPPPNTTTTPAFRPVPDRWLIIRYIQSDGILSRWRLSDDGKMLPETAPAPTSWKVFVVESNHVRSIDQIPNTDDLIATTSAYVDPTAPLDSQGEIFLGCSFSLQDWIGDLKTDPMGKQYIPLTIDRTGNPFFTDYQPQNPGVFSFYDDLTAHRGDPEYQEDRMTVLVSGTINYLVLGYHNPISRDPLVIDFQPPITAPSHRDRLKACFMEINPTGLSDHDLTWLESPGDAQMLTLLHGNAMSIDWDLTRKGIRPQPRSPADMCQEIMRKSQPIAVGTNAIDALLGWMRANTQSTTKMPSGNNFTFTPQDISIMEQQLLKIQTLAQSVDDGDIDSQLEAADMLATNNFVRHAAGTMWHLTKSTKDISIGEALDTLRSMNLSQQVLDAYLQEQAQLKLSLFQEWWKYVVDRDRGSEEEKSARRALTRAKATAIAARLLTLGNYDKAGGLIHLKYQEVQNLRGKIDCEPGVRPPFVSQQDPTILFAGIPSGRDENLMGKPLPVRLKGQEILGLDQNSSDAELARWLEGIDNVGQSLQGKVRGELVAPIVSLLKEAAWHANGEKGSVPPYGFMNDGILKEQPWFPLFVEWTIEYYHIPIHLWDFAIRGPEAKFQYGIKDGVDLSKMTDIQGDFRVMSGRSPVLPQVTSSLQILLKQLFSRMNPDELEEILPLHDRSQLLRSITELQYLSTTMRGFTDQLLTQMPGTHIQPTILSEQGTSTPLQAALKVGLEIGLDETSMALMDATSPCTPFASLTAIPADPSKFSPFKPCTHGQFRFTKLTLVDKFGQTVTPMNVLNPAGTKSPIYPCLSQTYSLETLADGTTANSVLSRPDENSEFAQLPPILNQPARINADFVEYDPKRRGWRPLDDWENPVSGWMVIDFPGYSIQVFDRDGHFIQEFQVMGASSVAAYPFQPTKLSQNATTALLRDLMERLAQPEYLRALFNTVSEAAMSVKHPPTVYAESMLSIMGRPLALVQMGFSLELCNAPLVNQSTIAADSNVSITDYEFYMKLGDMDNTLDGLSGFFDLDVLHPPTSSDSRDFKLDTFYSYFASSAGGDSASATTDPPSIIQHPRLIKLKPYYIPPDANVISYAAAHDWQRKVVAALVDPFVAVHAYTEILPTKLLSLPSWVLESGIKQVSAFFPMGPLLIPGDVPDFAADKAVDHSYELDEEKENVPATTGKIPIPSALQKDDWLWLQPFHQKNGGEQEVVPGTVYNFLYVDHVAEQPIWNDRDLPYTAVEGYLQMRRPFGEAGDNKS